MELVRRPGARDESVQIGDVLRQVFDILVRECPSDAGHIACIVGAASCLEVEELLFDVLGILSSDTRNLVLPHDAAEMPHRAEHLIGLFATGIYIRAVGLNLDRSLLLRRKDLPELAR